MIVYKATNTVNNKVYIGATTRTLNKRRKDHLSRARFSAKNARYRTCWYFHEAIQTYGADKFTWEVLCEVDNTKELYKKEIEYIALYQAFGPGGYNLSIGGKGNAGYKHSKETVERMRNRRHTEESKQKMRVANLGNKPSEETRQKLREHNLGKKATKETRAKMSASLKGKGTKSILCIELNKVFSSLTAASKELNVPISHVSQVCNGKRRKTGGYTFKFVNNN